MHGFDYAPLLAEAPVYAHMGRVFMTRGFKELGAASACKQANWAPTGAHFAIS